MRKKRRNNQYTTDSGSVDSLERISRKFSSDLRKQVRKINSHCDIFTKMFISEVDLFEHLAKIAKIESKPDLLLSPESFGVSRGKKSLWERDENCLRFIMEEGKVNVLIRKMIEFKEIQIKLRSSTLEEFTQLVKNSEIKDVGSGVLDRLTKLFESNLGTLLLCVFTAIEAIQGIEYQQFFGYFDKIIKHACSDIFDATDVNMITNFLEKQEYVIITNLFLLLLQIHESDDEALEEKVMNILLPKGIMNLLVQYFTKFEKILGNNEKVIIFGCLSMLTDTEEFKTFSNRYLDSDHTQILLSYHKSTIRPLLKMNSRNRKVLRSLNDFIIRSKIRSQNL